MPFELGNAYARVEDSEDVVATSLSRADLRASRLCSS